MRIRVRGGWFDTGTLRYQVDDRRGRLAGREGELLDFLLARLGTDQTRETLLQDVFGYNPKVKTRALDLAVFRLRKKIEQDPAEPVHLQTVPHVGYRLVIDESVADPLHDPLVQLQQLGSSLVESAEAGRGRQRILGTLWEDLDPSKQQALATLSLFRSPVHPDTVAAAFGPDLKTQAELLQREGLLMWEGGGLVMSRSLRAMATAACTEEDHQRFVDWATTSAERAQRWEGANPHAPLNLHGSELLALAATLPTAPSVRLASSVLHHTALVSARQLGRLDARTRDLDPSLRAAALRTLLRHRLESPDVLWDWAEELEELFDQLEPVEAVLGWLAVTGHQRMSGAPFDSDAAQRMLRLLEGQDAPGLEAQVWLRIANGSGGGARREAFQRAADHAKVAGSHLLMALALGGLATSAARATEETLSMVRLAVDLVPRSSATHAVVLTNLAAVALLCDPEAAEPLCAESLAKARSGARPALLGSALLCQADLDRIQHAAPLALERLDEASELLEGNRLWLDAQLRVVALQAELGHEEVARALLDALPPPSTPSQQILHVAAEAQLALPHDQDGARAQLAALADRGLALIVQEQVELAVYAHRGLWSQVGAR